MTISPRKLWMHHQNHPHPAQQVDAKLPRSTHEIMQQMKQHGFETPKLRRPPVPPTISLHRLTDYEMFDILEHFFEQSSKGGDIQMQWMLMDMQGRIPQ